MSFAKITDITASSTISFEAAVAEGIKRADKTIKNIRSAWVKDQEVSVKNGKIDSYRVTLKITFVLED